MSDSKNMSLGPIETINDNVDAVDVGRYYLEVEFLKLFKNSTKETTNTIVQTLKQLPENKVWGLLEAISLTYHLNGVFHNIARDNYVWKEEIWHVKDLVFTGMDPKINKLLFSEEINGDPIKFKNYLINYFKTADESDPEDLFRFKPTNKEMPLNKLIMKSQNGKMHMLDGSHRLVEMLLTNIDRVTAYVGHPLSQDAQDNPRSKSGHSLYILLTILFKKGNDEQRKAVLSVLKQSVDLSTDGQKNAEKYWIEHQTDEEIRKAGIKALKG